MALVLALGAVSAGCARPPVAAAPPATPGTLELSGQSTATGSTFRVVCHFPYPAAARAALLVAETAERVAAQVLGPPPSPRAPAAPLEIHLYRTVEDFDRAAEALTHSTSHDNLNFFVGDRLQAHILVQPLLSDEAFAAVGLPLLTKSVIAFQAAQLLRAAHSRGWALHPAWYAAGFGKWVALRTLEAVGAITDPARDPLWSSNIYDLQQLWRRLPAPSPDNTIEQAAYVATAGDASSPRAAPLNTHMPLPSEILTGDLSGALTQNEFFGVAWLTFETLMSPPFAATTRALVAELQALPAFDTPSPSLSAAIARAGGLRRIAGARIAQRARELFGADALQALDVAFERALTALTPHWTEAARSLDTTGRDWVQIAFPASLRASNHAVAWSLDRVPSPSFAIAGTATFIPNFGHQLNVLLELEDTKVLQVSFVAGDGVWFLLFDRGRSAWLDRRHVPTPGIAVGAPFTFRVAHAGKILTVEIDGRLVARLPIIAAANGRWGLGASEGTAGIWSHLRVAPLGER